MNKALNKTGVREMRYQMKLGPYGQDMYDTDLDEFLNTCECVDKMNELAGEIEKLRVENKLFNKFVDEIADHDWDLSDLGAREVWRGAFKLQKKLLKAEKEKVNV